MDNEYRLSWLRRFDRLADYLRRLQTEHKAERPIQPRDTEKGNHNARSAWRADNHHTD